ncbi:MAG: hypothetical protein AVDCRST_MAG75-1409 [uncultured Propionibacteriaceae bacterium]|uniref:MobA-like NTP transferase domain-containing protein n=1 Tax=uncultured Propionibacteriaceae bacterium TaxID=257457 RepID=A0A6J4NHT5_9ACTN|nr:MAG: hypothetical protein AVDCRST_MAG75-1409 [uncultured Propionibacteriaceae bacterium]
MSTETRRVALVLAQHAAVAPPGIDQAAYSRACLADTYEVLSDLEQVQAGIVGNAPVRAELLWPGDLGLSWPGSIRRLTEELAGIADQLVVVPADVPDLPGLMVAKVFKALQRAEVCCAPQRGDAAGCAAIGVQVPWPEWVSCDLDLDRANVDQLTVLAPRRSLAAVGPDWHRMRTAAAVGRLDPRLEGWEMTRALLSGQAMVD